MYRIEKSPELKVLLLLVHGMQDYWEAWTMLSNMRQELSGVDDTWTLILDLTDFESVEKGAIKEVRELAKFISHTRLRQKMVIRPLNPEASVELYDAAKLTVAPDFDQAWILSGGLPRDKKIAPPADGSKFPANTMPPA